MADCNAKDGGYRVPLFDRLRSAGHNVTMVGSATNGPASAPPAALSNEGHPGPRAFQLVRDCTLPPAVISPACQRKLDAWCNADTACVEVNKKDGYELPLVARYDVGSTGSTSKEWRCYSPSSLSPDRSRYTNGSAYCTAEKQLAAVLASCTASSTRSIGVRRAAASRDWGCWGDWPTARPDAIALHIGTNDIGDCYLGKGPFPGTKGVAACADYLAYELARLLNFTFASLPRVHVFLATIIAMPRYAFYNQTVQVFNSEVIPAAVARFSARGCSIELVPVHAATGICTPSGGDCCGDLVHPTGAIGYPRMAEAWFTAMNATKVTSLHTAGQEDPTAAAIPHVATSFVTTQIINCTADFPACPLLPNASDPGKAMHVTRFSENIAQDGPGFKQRIGPTSLLAKDENQVMVYRFDLGCQFLLWVDASGVIEKVLNCSKAKIEVPANHTKWATSYVGEIETGRAQLDAIEACTSSLKPVCPRWKFLHNSSEGCTDHHSYTVKQSQEWLLAPTTPPVVPSQATYYPKRFTNDINYPIAAPPVCKGGDHVYWHADWTTFSVAPEADLFAVPKSCVTVDAQTLRAGYKGGLLR